MISIEFWPTKKELNDFGVVLLNADNYAEYLEGYSVYMDEQTGKPRTNKLFLKKEL